MNNINYSLSLQMGRLLEERGLMIAVAESCTGGALATEITAVPGCSEYFDRGFVTYTNEAKHEVLSVDAKLISEYGAVSEHVAKAMAQGTLQHSRADIAVSITGIAGPQGGTPEKPVGLVWLGLAVRDGDCAAREVHFGGGRKQVRRLSVGAALEWVIETVAKGMVLSSVI